jgi:hypothetical protein
MTNRIRPLATVAVAATLSVTVTAAAAAQVTAATPDTTRAAGPAAPAPTPTEAVAGRRYTLMDVGGKALPVEIEKEWRCRDEVTAGTLVLREDSRWHLETSVRETCGTRTKMDQEDEDGIYRTEGSTIHFLDDDGDRNDADWSLEAEIDLDELDHGSIADGDLLSVRLADEKTVLRFRREGI